MIKKISTKKIFNYDLASGGFHLFSHLKSRVYFGFSIFKKITKSTFYHDSRNIERIRVKIIKFFIYYFYIKLPVWELGNPALPGN